MSTPEKKRNAGFYIYNMRCDLDRAAEAVTKRVGYEAKNALIPFVEPTSAVLTVAHPAARGSGFPALRKSEAEEGLYRDKAISQLEAAQTFLPAFPTDEIELRTLCQDAVDLARLILRLDVEFLDQKYEGWALKISDDLKAWTDAYEARA